MRWLGLSILVVATQARAQQAPDPCAGVVDPVVGTPGKDVLWQPTPDAAVLRMLALADVKSNDVVIDLGSGDGRIPIAAARDRGATALGIEYNSALVAYARCAAHKAGVSARATFVEGDVFASDFAHASVVTTFLLPEMNLCLRARLLAMEPGTRVAAYRFAMADWQPDVRERVGEHDVFLWIVPARVEGAWRVTDADGRTYSIALQQSFQHVTGAVRVGRGKRPIVDVALHGRALTLAFADERGAVRTLRATIDGATMTGALAGAGGEVRVEGRAHSPPRAGAWATSPPVCEKFSAPLPGAAAR